MNLASFCADIHFETSHLCLQHDAQAAVDKLLSQDGPKQLDALVWQLSVEMVNEAPANDPRWAENQPNGFNSFFFLIFSSP